MEMQLLLKEYANDSDSKRNLFYMDACHLQKQNATHSKLICNPF